MDMTLPWLVRAVMALLRECWQPGKGPSLCPGKGKLQWTQVVTKKFPSTPQRAVGCRQEPAPTDSTEMEPGDHKEVSGLDPSVDPSGWERVGRVLSAAGDMSWGSRGDNGAGAAF